MRPTRHAVVVKAMEAFVREFFDLNPISHMGIIVTKSRKATLVTEMGGNPSQHIEALSGPGLTVGAEPSLQNALNLAKTSLASLPKYGAREILVVFSSLTTCDPGNVLHTINEVRDAGIRASVIGFGAALRVLQYLADATGGKYAVPTSSHHFRQILLSHAVPTPVKRGAQAFGNALVKMGFPGVETPAGPEHNPGTVTDTRAVASLCACHQYLTDTGYICPNCGSKMCEIPTDCVTCGLTLVAPPHLARSYHHLFPVAKYEPPSADVLAALPGSCFACAALLPPVATVDNAPFRVCPLCHQLFCFECDNFVHDTLHNCPGCQMPAHAPAEPQKASYPSQAAAATSSQP